MRLARSFSSLLAIWPCIVPNILNHDVVYRSLPRLSAVYVNSLSLQLAWWALDTIPGSTAAWRCFIVCKVVTETVLLALLAHAFDLPAKVLGVICDDRARPLRLGLAVECASYSARKLRFYVLC